MFSDSLMRDKLSLLLCPEKLGGKQAGLVAWLRLPHLLRLVPAQTGYPLGPTCPALAPMKSRTSLRLRSAFKTRLYF